MELRHLRYFLEVANTLHFGAAAQTLDIAVPTLSVQIAQLERELGTPLFVRTQRRVALTQAGEMLRDEAEATIRQAEQAKARVQSVARGEQGYLRVGYVSSALMSGVLGTLFTRYRKRYPDATNDIVILVCSFLTGGIFATWFAFIFSIPKEGLKNATTQTVTYAMSTFWVCTFLLATINSQLIGWSVDLTGGFSVGFTYVFALMVVSPIVALLVFPKKAR